MSIDQSNTPKPPMPSPVVWIVDAAPFIGLAKIGRLELLTDKNRVAFLPDAVVDEVAAGPPNDPAVIALHSLSQ